MASRIATIAFVMFLLVQVSAAADSGYYTAVNPSSSSAPDCEVPFEGVTLGLGGACFDIPADATEFTVRIEDAVFGPGFGALNLCREMPSGISCNPVAICNGFATGSVPEGTTSASVVVFNPASASSLCGPGALTWVPTHGVIHLTWSS